ncbi:hypothetical protein NDU88_000487 [Pleurodeles waltl]|uniref:Uncharacterized protein n=1 Tax=Pleurodeles waltl TaxID=8319 RepID=A0AAV7S696_PLEWA|nr:hypothetical protein NDU88_000487 [Pleurodeles waltl]
MPRKHQEAEPAQERAAECELGRSLTEEPNRRPQAGSTLFADKEDGDWSVTVPSGCRVAEAEADIREDEKAWFEDCRSRISKPQNPPQLRRVVADAVNGGGAGLTLSACCTRSTRKRSRPRRDVECETMKSSTEEHSQSPNEALLTMKRIGTGAGSVPSCCRVLETEADIGEDEEAWFEDWWMPPVKMTQTATTEESCG